MLGRTALAIAICSTVAYAQKDSIPTADIKGSQDSSLLKRYDGSFIVAYDRKSFDEFTLPLSPLEPLCPRNERRRTTASSNLKEKGSRRQPHADRIPRSR